MAGGGGGLALAQAYLRESSIHGLRYLVHQDEGEDGRRRRRPGRRRPLLERLLWCLAIAGSFSFLVIFAYESVSEASRNPMSTSIESVPVRELDFPAVTIHTAERRHVMSGFQQELLNNVEFDCTLEEEGDGGAGSCAERTADLRAALAGAPVRMATQTRQLLHALNSARSVDYLHHALCFSDFLTENRGLFVDMLMALEAAAERNRTQEARDELVKLAVKCFRVPEYDCLPAVSDFTGMPQPGNSSGLSGTHDSECYLEVSHLRHSPHIRPVLGFFVASGHRDGMPLLLGDLVADVDRRGAYKNFWPGVTYSPRVASLLTALWKATADLAATNATASPTLTVADVVSYAAYGTIESGRAYDFVRHVGFPTATPTEQDGMCFHVRDDVGRKRFWCQFEENPEKCHNRVKDHTVSGQAKVCANTGKELAKIYRALLRVMKYTRPTAGRDLLKNDGRAGDTERGFVHFEKRGFGRTPQKHLQHVRPLVLSCGFGRASAAGLSPDCSRFFVSTFTDRGVAYTFNAAEFWEMHKRTADTEAFFDEYYGDSGAGESAPLKTNSSGLAFALRLRLRLPFSVGTMLTVHNPAVPASFRSKEKVLPLSYFYRYVVKVGASQVTMDKSLLEHMDPDWRRCLSPEEGGDRTRVFKRYSQDACLLECHVLGALKKCGCVPWDYIRVADDQPVCPGWSMECFDKYMDSPDEEVVADGGCDCPADCSVTNYVVFDTSSSFGKSGEAGEGDIFDEDWCTFEANRRSLGIPGSLPNPVLRSDVTIGEEMTCSDETRRVAEVVVYVSTKEVERIRKTLRVTPVDQLAALGGMMGLFIGMSFLSVFEMAMWICRPILDALGCQATGTKRRRRRRLENVACRKNNLV